MPSDHWLPYAIARTAGPVLPTVAASGIVIPPKPKLIESLAHPGGKITGISDVRSTLNRQALPLLSRKCRRN